MSQTDVHTAPPVDHDDIGAGAPSNVDAHMPPQPGEVDSAHNPIYRGATWNPLTNEWAPSNEQHDTFGVAEPSHGDEPIARPMSETPGQLPGSEGSEPEPRLNLLDSVRAPQPVAPPPQRVEHYVETREVGGDSDLVKCRQVQVSASLTQLLEENTARKRALCRIPAVATAPLTQAVTNPAAGANFTQTVPTGQTWTLDSINATLVTSAVVANRLMRITITLPSGAATVLTAAGTVQTASNIVVYLFTQGGTQSASGGPIPAGLVLPAGTIISSSVQNIDVGDQLSAISLVVNQTATAVPIWVQGRALGGGATATATWVQLNPGDPPLEVKSTSGIDAIAPAATTGTTVAVQVYEELNAKDGVPGLTG